MNVLISQLMEIGYTNEKANELLEKYISWNKIDGLQDYVETKMRILGK